MRNIRNEKGFTLIELMVVILIIGILVAIAVPVFNSARQSAYQRTCQANLRTLDGAIQTWKASGGNAYPSTIAEATTDLVPDYIKAWPSCPEKTTENGVYKILSGGGSVPPVFTCPNGHSYP
ncbi:MAG TPA: type II secretion system protein [Candidatus Aquicultor sp.]|jgi:type IV pilus assembly protein PilA